MQHEPPRWLLAATGLGQHLTRAWRPLGAAYFRCVEALYRVSIGLPLIP